MNDGPRYWFPAKRYGWGWGLPATWQGWVVMLVWTVAYVGGSVWIAARSLPWFFLFCGVMVAVLISVCYAKGEPPRWRWGEK
ncbi:MAG: hypothetical protein JNL96_14490 [Planctomycetaceae bacterium]|nr:hypothetical protein [Planctomycetaceae bacterium]